VKENQEKDKIESKPDKNEKRVFKCDIEVVLSIIQCPDFDSLFMFDFPFFLHLICFCQILKLFDFLVSGLDHFVLCDAEYESDSSDDQSCSDEDVLEKIVSKPLSEEEIIPMESLRTHDSSFPISSKIDSLLDEFAGELNLLNFLDKHPVTFQSD
nr:hypothetical protein [Tanacetum cinerariifolium]